MTNMGKLKEFCKTHDFREQRDILAEEASEMIMLLSGMSTGYFSAFISKPTLECYAFIESLVDLEIMLTQMTIYMGDDGIESFIYNNQPDVKTSTKELLLNKDDIYYLAYLNKIISKMRRNDKATDTAKAYKLFKDCLCLLMMRFVDYAREAINSKGLMDYYNQLFERKLTKTIDIFKEATDEY